MKTITLYLLSSLFICCNSYGQQFSTDFFIGPGIGKLSSTDGYSITGNLGFKGIFAWKGFYVNLGLGVYYLNGSEPGFGNYKRDASDVYLEIPVGLGFYSHEKGFTFQIGADIAYMTNVSFTETPIVVSPQLILMGDTKNKKLGIGGMIKPMFPVYGEPSYFGVGVIFRTY